MKKIFFYLLLGMLSLPTLTGCNTQKPNLKIGYIQGFEEEILLEVQKEAINQGFSLELVPFKDYDQINIALKYKQIDANCFQNEYYLQAANKKLETNFVSVGQTYLAPLAGYSSKHQSLKDLPASAQVVLADDLKSVSRALTILVQAGLIELKPHTQFFFDLTDILANPLDLKFIVLEASELNIAYQEADLIFLNPNYAHNMNLSLPDALCQESIKSDFTQIIVTRPELKAAENIKNFVTIYHSDKIKEFILKEYQGNLLPAW